MLSIHLMARLYHYLHSCISSSHFAFPQSSFFLHTQRTSVGYMYIVYHRRSYNQSDNRLVIPSHRGTCKCQSPKRKVVFHNLQMPHPGSITNHKDRTNSTVLSLLFCNPHCARGNGVTRRIRRPNRRCIPSERWGDDLRSAGDHGRRDALVVTNDAQFL